MFLACYLFQAVENLNFISGTINFTPNITFFDVFNYDFLITGRLIETGRLISEYQNLRLYSTFNRDFPEIFGARCLKEMGHLTFRTEDLRFLCFYR